MNEVINYNEFKVCNFNKLKLGDVVYCLDEMYDIIPYTFIACAGDFVLVSADGVIENIGEKLQCIANNAFDTYQVKVFYKEKVYVDKNEKNEIEKSLNHNLLSLYESNEENEKGGE